MPEVAEATAVSETTDERTEDTVAGSTPAEPSLVESDLLVEDVSIDGMCGVY